MSSLRSSGLYLCLGMVLCACEVRGLALEQAAALADGARVDRPRILQEQEGRTELTLPLATAQDLSVVLSHVDDGEPVSGTTVTFALEGDTGAASLRELTVTTTEDGVASTFLSAGDVPGQFDVRATAAGAEPLRIAITVLQPRIKSLQVRLPYSGLREVTAREVRAYANTSCDALQAIAPDERPHPAARDRWEDGSEQTTLSVDANRGRLTLVAHALGPLDNVVASSCMSLGPLLQDRTELTLALEDASIRMEGAYDLQVGLEVSASADRIRQALLDNTATVLPDPIAPNATRLLNAVEDTLREDGQEEAARSVYELASGTSVPSLPEQLESVLLASERGFAEVLRELADEVAKRGANLDVDAELSAVGMGADDLVYAPVGLHARGTEGELPLALQFGPARDVDTVPGSISATFDVARSLLTIHTLRISLGLGTYGDALLHALVQEESYLPNALRSVAGCAEFDGWVSGQEPLALLCDADCAARACDLAIEALVRDSGTELQALDALHPTIGLRGQVPVYDLDGDGIADQVVETLLLGSWGRAEKESSADTVDGTLMSVYVP